MKQLFIYGAGGHAEVVAATARLCGYEIAGFWEDSTARVGGDFFGSKIIRFEDVPSGAEIFLAFGNNRIRLEKGRNLQSRFSIATLIHPSAQIAEGVKIGKGCFIGALANIDPGVTIGDFCIVNKLANISHDSIVGNGTHVSVGSLLAGHVRIEDCCCIGMGVSIIENKVIGHDSIIGAGAVVIRDLPPLVTAAGMPAKIIKTENNG